jgi:hypothetical protein
MFRRDRKPPCFGWLARTAPSQGRRRPTVAYRAQRPSHVKSWNHDREYTWVTAESLTRTGMSPPREIMLDIAAKLATLFLGLAPPDIRRSQAQEESRRGPLFDRAAHTPHGGDRSLYRAGAAQCGRPGLNRPVERGALPQES